MPNQKMKTTTLTSRFSFLYARSLHAVSKRLMCASCSSSSGPYCKSPIRLGLLTLSQCRILLLSVIFITTGMLFLPKLYIFRAHHPSLSLQLRSFASSSSSSSSSLSDINIWYQSSLCKAANLTSIPSAYSSNYFPYAALRDAVVDRRPSVANFFAQQVNHTTHGDGVRVLLLVTVHNSARLSREKSIGRVVHGDEESQTVFEVTVEYVLHATSFLLRHPTRYKPGTRTVHGRQVTEWHIGLYIRRPDPNHHASHAALFDSLFGATSSSYHQSKTKSTTTSAMNLKLKLAFNLLRFDGQQIPFMPEMTLACINAWVLPPDIATTTNTTHATTTSSTSSNIQNTDHHNSISCSKSNRAVLISGGALYGKKQAKTEHYKEVAHFIARALTGPVKYDAVLVTVVSAVAMSDRLFSCGRWTGCSERMGQRNNDLLNRVGVEIAKEFDKIGIDRVLLRRVVLVPICTLGSDAEVSEQWNPCSQSKHSGQYWSTTLAYATVSKYYKWAASHDIDEFFAPAPGSHNEDNSRRIHSESAMKAFDKAHALLGRNQYGGFIMQWLNFKLLSTNDARDLTRRLARSRMLLLEDRVNASRSRQCYQRLRDDTGKSVVHCDAGLGFTIHHPVLISKKSRRHGMPPSFGFKQGQAMFRGMRTWHARLVSSKGTCHYRAAGEHPLTRMEVEYRRRNSDYAATQRNKLLNDDVDDNSRGSRDQIGDDDAKLIRGMMKSKHI